MLGVDRHELSRCEERHDEVATDDDGLLVRIGKALPRLRGCIAGFDAGKADHGRDDAVHIVAAGELHERLGAREDLSCRWKL